MTGLSDFIDGLADRVNGAGAAAETATKSALVNKIPGSGVLFTHDIENGFRLTGIGTAAALVLAAYGLYRMAGR